MADQTAPVAHEYRTEVKQLLDILAHSLYTDREIFLRELISNASDALNRLQFEMLTNHEVVDRDAELAIRIYADPETRTLTISDSGIGMNRDELVENLGTIAHSGARAFLQNAGAGQSALEEIIGQFGVGFYSVFMVADEVRVLSRSYRPEDQAWAWRSTGDSTYTVEPADRTERGTTIEIKLKEDAGEFAQSWRIEQIIKKHSDYVSFPIYLVDKDEEQEGEKEDGEQDGEKTAGRIINRRTALWRQSPSKVEASEYNEFYKQLTYDSDDPLLHLHMVADAPVNLRAVLFVPAKRERGRLYLRPEHGLRLYSRKILIQERNKDLLPDYYRFVEGVVDSEDLPLNVSREMVQSNPVMRQIRRALTNRLNKELKTLADESPERYVAFWTEFGPYLKEGVAVDAANQETLIDLLRFRTSKGGDAWVSVQQYVERMKPDQEAIYYVLGEDLKSVARSPHLDYFRAHDIEVLYLVDPIDGFVTSMLREMGGKPLRNVDDAGLSLPADQQAEQEAAPQEQFDKLVERIKQVLGERVLGVQESKQLVNSPCRLVSPADSPDRDLQRLRRLTEEDYETPKKLLELNRRHPLIANLAHLAAHTPDDPLINAAVEQLYDNALLLEGLHANPVDMVERIQLLMEQAVAAKANSQ
ncbi:MAG TPA: molecular chaperone HtpG [Caldilineaceae bacterium]|nr:molecular chaperone HtpG [Caldilineaceae bacterium]